MEMQIIIKGATTTELLKNLNGAIAAFEGNQVATVAASTKTKKAKPVAVAAVEETIEEESFDDEIVETDESDFAEEVEEVAPVKAKKAAKLTSDDVRKAAIAHAKANADKGGRTLTLKLISKALKVNVGSLDEIKEADYAKVVAAVKV